MTAATTIAADQDVATLINVFTVTRENQQPLVDLLIAATEQVMRQRPGFVSANIHTSLDGTRVVNYVQWRSREEFQKMLNDPTAQEHINAIKTLATSEANLYEVASIHHT